MIVVIFEKFSLHLGILVLKGVLILIEVRCLINNLIDELLYPFLLVREILLGWALFLNVRLLLFLLLKRNLSSRDRVIDHRLLFGAGRTLDVVKVHASAALVFF